MAADFSKSKSAITSNLADNNTQNITASKLRTTLNQIVDDATLSINTVTPDLSQVNAKISSVESQVNSTNSTVSQILADQQKIVNDLPEWLGVYKFSDLGSGLNDFFEDEFASLQDDIADMDGRLTQDEIYIEDLKDNKVDKRVITILKYGTSYNFAQGADWESIKDWTDVDNLLNYNFKFNITTSGGGASKNGTWALKPTNVFTSSDASWKNNYLAYIYFDSYDGNYPYIIVKKDLSIQIIGNMMWER